MRGMTELTAPIIFGTSCLGNLYRAIPMETKTAIAAEWFKAYPKPVIDSAGKYGAGLSLECIGKALRALGKKLGDNHRMNLPGVVSRKKQVVPPLTDVFEG